MPQADATIQAALRESKSFDILWSGASSIETPGTTRNVIQQGLKMDDMRFSLICA